MQERTFESRWVSARCLPEHGIHLPWLEIPTRLVAQAQSKQNFVGGERTQLSADELELVLSDNRLGLVRGVVGGEKMNERLIYISVEAVVPRGGDGRTSWKQAVGKVYRKGER